MGGAIHMARAVGIDLGTTNSVVAVLEGGEPTVIPNSEGSRTTPSVVGYSKNGEILVGEVAKRQAITNPDRTVRSIKRHMGEKDWSLEVDGKKWTPQEISAQTLAKLKRDAESTHGDTHLGGDDWDQRVIDWLVAEFKKANSVDISGDRMAMQRLKEAAEKAKIELSQVTETTINLPFVTATKSDDGTMSPLHLEARLTRAEFERMTADLVDRCKGPCEQAVKVWGKRLSESDHVILVGGATRMPMTLDLVRKLTGGKDPHKGVNPDEVVAVGAAIQAGVLKGDVKDILLLDVTPLTLGVETKGGIFTRLIERNTTIPTRKSEVFTTADDNQMQVEIHILQGEAQTVHSPGVRSLGQFQLMGIPPAPRGVPQIEVAFDIDANGIVNVSAKDLATGKEQAMTITGGTALGKDEIDRMVVEAEKFADEDRKRREVAEARNNADNLSYQVDKALSEYGDKIPGGEKDDLVKANDEVKEALKGDDAEAIKAAADRLMEAYQKVGPAMYQAQQPEGGQQSGTEGPAGDGAGGSATEGRRSEAPPGAGVHPGHPAGTNDLNRAQAQVDEYRDHLQRLQAEFDNF